MSTYSTLQILGPFRPPARHSLSQNRVLESVPANLWERSTRTNKNTEKNAHHSVPANLREQSTETNKKQRHYFLYLNHFPKICGLEQREQTRQEQKKHTRIHCHKFVGRPTQTNPKNILPLSPHPVSHRLTLLIFFPQLIRSIGSLPRANRRVKIRHLDPYNTRDGVRIKPTTIPMDFQTPTTLRHISPGHQPPYWHWQRL
jgi:hypothetical protein